jgi:hypothetical protein
VKERYLKVFLEKIQPFRDLWRSVRFTAYAGAIGCTWIFMGGRVQLSEKEIPSQALNKVAISTHFLPLSNEFSIRVVRRETENLVQRKNKRTHLTPTGLLMEGVSAH